MWSKGKKIWSYSEPKKQKKQPQEMRIGVQESNKSQVKNKVTLTNVLQIQGKKVFNGLEDRIKQESEKKRRK